MIKQSDAELEQLDAWNTEDAEELELPKKVGDYNVAIAARDWTVETIVQQVKQGNIDLDPAFQRRNAWRDPRRSRLIESFILGFPVPQIVLAENPRKKKTFIVIDGKQRLMTVAGLYLDDFRPYWNQPRFSGLKVLTDLNKVLLDEFLHDSDYSAERRQLENADIRTTIITGFHDEEVLYDIFYRINTGSVPLSSQELRQVLNRGEFARYLLETTSRKNPLWQILSIEGPDPRLRDCELLLRLIAWKKFSTLYAGNMKPFLDDTMTKLNDHWDKQRIAVEEMVEEIFLGINAVIRVFGKNAGRKFKGGKFETSINRALFEVQAFYFSQPSVRDALAGNEKALVTAFRDLGSDDEFTRSVEATTKSIENYRIRFEKYRSVLTKVLGIGVPSLAVGHSARSK